MKKICLIAQFPPPIHGLSKAVDTLYNSVLQDEFILEKIDITKNQYFGKNLVRICRSNADLFYLTISQTVGGNIRDLIIISLLKIQRKKCLIHLHGGYYRKLIDNDLSFLQRKLNYYLLKKVDGGIILGPSLKWIFQDILPNDKIYIVRNCVDDKYLMSDIEFDKKIDTLHSKEIKRVLYLSNFVFTKGYIKVLEMAMFEKENKGLRRFHFDFAGTFFSEDEKRDFFEFIRENELEEYITYHGAVYDNDKIELLQNCDIFVLPTTYPKEGQPISILEAMANGLYILTTKHAGIPDIVSDGINGTLVNCDDSSREMYNILCGIDNSLLKNIAINNRKQCKEIYKEDIYIESMRNVFNDIYRRYIN